MSRHERYGTRDLTFSRWHRTLSNDATCIDLDFCEYCNHCKKPLALIETARDVGQAFKPTTILRELAKQADIPAWLILYTIREDSPHGIGSCKIKSVWPNSSDLIVCTLDAIGRRIEKLHADCPCRLTSR